MKTTNLPELPDPNDSWAIVELYRWQHGHLPNDPRHEEKKLDEAAGLEGMARAIEKNDRKNFPTPMNVVSVLLYSASRLRKIRAEALEEAVNAVKGSQVEALTGQQDDVLQAAVASLEGLKRS